MIFFYCQVNNPFIYTEVINVLIFLVTVIPRAPWKPGDPRVPGFP